MTQTMRPTAENWSCGFEAEPRNWVCAKDATWHGFRMTADGWDIEAMMASCDDHLPRMGANANWVHPMKSACGIPDSRFVWPENFCYLEEGAETLLGAETEAVSA